MSRHTKKSSSSRFAHISPTLMLGQRAAGSITIVGNGSTGASAPTTGSVINSMNPDFVLRTAGRLNSPALLPFDLHPRRRGRQVHDERLTRHPPACVLRLARQRGENIRFSNP